MKKIENIIKYSLSLAFCIFLSAFFILNFNNGLKSIHNSFKTGIKIDSNYFSNIEKNYVSSFTFKYYFIDFNNYLVKLFNMNSYYNSDNIYITNDKYIVSQYSYTTTDYEYKQTVLFRDFLEKNGINLLYVNEPTKYIDDSFFSKEFGVETYINRNANLFLRRIRNEGINVVDLRDSIDLESINTFDLFYRTDHHWTVPAGLWASEKIAKGLNEKCGYDIDLSVLDLSNFKKKMWTSCWLGEQGRKTGKPLVGFDDYTEIKPLFNTDYIFKEENGSLCSGTFEDFVDESVYDNNNKSWHYSYKVKNAINNNVENGKILFLGDSFDHVTEPFLSLCVHEIDFLILRNYDDSFKLKDFIIKNNYDTVIIAYAQFMIGAHDNSSSANYRMFSFN